MTACLSLPLFQIQLLSLGTHVWEWDEVVKRFSSILEGINKGDRESNILFAIYCLQRRKKMSKWNEFLTEEDKCNVLFSFVAAAVVLIFPFISQDVLHAVPMYKLHTYIYVCACFVSVKPACERKAWLPYLACVRFCLVINIWVQKGTFLYVRSICRPFMASAFDFVSFRATCLYVCPLDLQTRLHVIYISHHMHTMGVSNTKRQSISKVI